MEKVLATGVFDILHSGHLYYLRQAKLLGDYLVVLVASDRTARRAGKKLVFHQAERKALIAELKLVDEVIAGAEKIDYLRTIQLIKPAVVALGFDQQIDEEKLSRRLAAVNWQGRIVRLAQNPDWAFSSRQIKQKISALISQNV